MTEAKVFLNGELIGTHSDPAGPGGEHKETTEK